MHCQKRFYVKQQQIDKRRWILQNKQKQKRKWIRKKKQIEKQNTAVNIRMNTYRKS